MALVPQPTERLEFRTWTERDLELALGLWGDRRVTEHIDARAELAQSDVEARLIAEIQHARDHDVQYWPIFARATGEHIGACGLHTRDTDRHVYEIGFHVRARHWGRGFATESARAVIAFGFERLGARALFAGHHPDNSRSRHTLEKLGFRYTHDELYAPTGLQHPSYLLSERTYRERLEKLA